jgi:hypothetical protein
MEWISQSPEVWVGAALLCVIVIAITHAAFSKKTDARMDFFFRLLEELPTDDVPAPRIETSPVQPRQER